MKKIFELVNIVAIIFSVSLIFTSPAFAYLAKLQIVFVHVINRMDHPICFNIDNNRSSTYKGNHSVAARGEIDDTMVFSFMTNDNEEFYTISYHGASCKIDYPLMDGHYHMEVDITGSDADPHCKFHDIV